MASRRIPLASWCPVCDSKDINQAPVDQAVELPGVDGVMKTRPWSCRACGALWLMTTPLTVSHAPPAEEQRLRPLSSWHVNLDGRVTELQHARVASRGRR